VRCRPGPIARWARARSRAKIDAPRRVAQDRNRGGRRHHGEHAPQRAEAGGDGGCARAGRGDLVTAALGLPAARGRIVTDALHFVGSFHLYQQLAQRGMELVVLRMRDDGSIDPKQYEAAITPDTKLVGGGAGQRGLSAVGAGPGTGPVPTRAGRTLAASSGGRAAAVASPTTCTAPAAPLPERVE
jgi:hypothetical protein